MSKKTEIDVHHITRVEGHGNIVVRASDGKIEKVEWQVPEAPRFFEAMVRGRPWHDIQTIVSRICGICSITHSFAATKGVEDALGIKVSEQTDKLRHLTHYAEYLQSHVLHIGYLVVPDLLKAKSVVPLVATHGDAVKTVIRLHRTANEMSDWLAGRTTHPVTIVPGGFTQLPTEADIKVWKDRLANQVVPDLKAVAQLVVALAGNLPAFDRPTEYIALTHPNYYTFYQGKIASTDTKEQVDIHEFERVVNEYVIPQSTSKWCKWHRDSYAVGALARFNINAEKLLPLAASVAKMLGLKKGCQNPFMNTVAQVVEAVQAVEHALQIMDELLTKGIKAEKPAKVTPKAGEGVGCVEAPRGILFHRYVFDKNGKCERGNICIPTGQNHGNIQKDFEALVPKMIDKPQDEIRQAMEMLVRAYDPCISCSTHYLDVKFV
jgi:coenzyme F420-reducing hydrogenase alpha subunit